MQPTGLAIANLQRPKLANVKSAEDANKVMQRRVEAALRRQAEASNPMGRDLLLAEFVTFYIQFADSAKRGDVGFPGDKNQWVDMLKVADSLFTHHRERRAQVREHDARLAQLQAVHRSHQGGVRRGRCGCGRHGGETREARDDPEPHRAAAVRRALARRADPQGRGEGDRNLQMRRTSSGRHAERGRALELPLHARADAAGFRRRQRPTRPRRTSCIGMRPRRT